MKHRKKTLLRILAVVLTAAAVLSVTAAVTATEQNVYNDPNPELKTALISTGKQGSQYDNASDYTPDAKFTQENGTYTMETNAFAIWGAADDCTFMYREYEIGNKATDKLTITVDLTDFQGTKGGKHENASAGIMIRDDLDPDAPSIFFHSRTIGLYNIWRTEKGGGSGFASVSVSESYPIKLKIEKVGNKYTAYYMLKGTNAWSQHSMKYLNLTGTIYVGITMHASDKARPVLSQFNNLEIVGEGTPDIPPTDGGGSDSGVPPVVGEGIPWEDAPYNKETTLLYETFTDGSMTLGESGADNPIWDTAYPNIVLTEDGDRKWYRDHITSYDHIGSADWTDYTTSIEVAFDDMDMETRADGNFILYARHSVVHSLGHTAYGVRMYAKTDSGATTYYMALVKRMRNNKSTAQRVTIETKEIADFFGDGPHNIEVRTFDNRITVWYDGVEMFDYYDMCGTPADPYKRDGLGAFVASKGNIGIYSKDFGVTVDNILVTKLDDPHGGDYDNNISDNWDEDIPDYVLEFNK